MELKIINQEFAICKIRDLSQVDYSDSFCFVGKTDEELSLVCDKNKIPKSAIERDLGWRGFRIQGVLDFSLVGILAKIAKILAKNKIGIFVISTYNTDYVLIKEKNLEAAIVALSKKGYKIIR